MPRDGSLVSLREKLIASRRAAARPPRRRRIRRRLCRFGRCSRGGILGFGTLRSASRDRTRSFFVIVVVVVVRFDQGFRFRHVAARRSRIAHGHTILPVSGLRRLRHLGRRGRLGIVVDDEAVPRVIEGSARRERFAFAVAVHAFNMGRLEPVQEPKLGRVSGERDEQDGRGPRHERHGVISRVSDRVHRVRCQLYARERG